MSNSKNLLVARIATKRARANFAAVQQILAQVTK